MAKEYQFNWRSQIPTTFVKGTAFDRYDDESTCLELGALFRVDEYGFFLHWQIDGRDAVVLDLAAIWEARPCSAPPKDGRILFELEQRGPRETLEERTTWITHGQDLVNVSSFYIVAHDVETAREWRNGLNELLKNHKMRHLCPTTCLQKHWRYLCLSLNDRHKIPIRNIVKTFSSGKPEKMVHKCLSDLGLAGDKYVVTIRRTWQRNIRNLVKCSTARKQKEREELDVELFTFEKFLRLYHKICPRTDVQELFVKLSGQKEYLTRDRLINFLNDEQRDPRLNEILFPFFDNDRVQQLIAKYEIDENYIANGKMSGDAFLRFLMSDENAPVFLDRIELFMDMEQPLCHYYINSSHNTYLTGRQYGGKSSTEIYRQVLLSGCRCIELDCWDGTGENKGEPIITHGKAMCTDVFFKEVLYQIRDTAFARSDYPVILSFENHCSKSNQLKMAKYCMDIFGDMLLSKPFDDFPLEPGVPLPSPNRLKRKILIKNKRLKADIEKHQMEQFLREGKLDEEDEVTETPEVVGEDTVVPPVDEDTSDDDDPSVQSSSNVIRRVCSASSTSASPSTSQLTIASSCTSSPRTPLQVDRPDYLSTSSPSEMLNRSCSTGRRSKFSLRSMTSSIRRSAREAGSSNSSPQRRHTHHTQTTTTSCATGDQRAHPEAESGSAASGTTTNASTPAPVANSSSTDLPGKEMDEAHPELKQTNFISKLKPLGFAKKPQLGSSTFQLPQIIRPRDSLSGSSSSFREKRSFRRPSTTDHSISAALLDAQPFLRRLPSARIKPKKTKPTLTKEEEERIFAEYHYTGATTNIHPLLSTLVNYTHPVKFSGFDVAEMNNLYFHMSSFSESTGLGYLKQNAPEFVNYNKRQLSRIYPKGARVDSSNFLPQIFWNAGCQMVSLNFQTPDVCMQLNQGKFEYNGFCGYLLKPDFMRRPDRNFDPFSESPVDGVIAAHCSVRVISGQFLCDRKVGTYVEVEMYGLPTDTIRKEHRTRMIPANGLNPVYNEEPFVFRKVVLPELAVLRFAVYDENGKQLGQRILPLDGLQAGFRHISLRTESNSPTVLPTLFVHLGLKTYVPDELSGLVDALADPRAYLSQQEKLKEALHNMGVDDADIVEVPQNKNGSAKGASAVAKTVVPGIKSLKINGSSTAGPHDSNAATPSVPQKDQPNSAKSNAEGAESKFKIEAIDVQELKKDKAFIKLSKKFQKDIDDMKKRHQKQRDACQKQQQTNIDKLMCDSQKSSKKKHSHGNNSAPNTSRHSSLSGRLSNSGGISDMSNNYKMRSLVSNQTDEWSSLIRRQEAEEFEQKKTHIKEELDVLRKLMTEAQKQQLIALKQKLENEGRELKQMQTKKSMDDTKIIQQDKTIKTKAEKDRRVKELNEKNVKMFVEERKRLAMKAEKHEEQLTKRHQDQNEQLEKDYAKVLEQEEMNYRESLLASRPESVV
ncbi:hypothetical protein QR680_006946 [Steinernema hermaphroditum]|uniref:Phosphoinositide phospholipase C n=1 Tax=Steinernema hermaphroditum TaxID=289476 RepID=A0AA39HX25_9BILA|nr:hypothetical protein QR680_006946 [Steinernema hermaphroditum]